MAAPQKERYGGRLLAADLKHNFAEELRDPSVTRRDLRILSVLRNKKPARQKRPKDAKETAEQGIQCQPTPTIHYFLLELKTGETVHQTTLATEECY